MVTKTQRSKAAERIELAKRRYNVAEQTTDNMIVKLAKCPYTLATIVVLGMVLVGLWLA